ncbi:hypothetical protein HYY75_03785, partial [bacterium]|nr:hypothetical protein [bacterium]
MYAPDQYVMIPQPTNVEKPYREPRYFPLILVVRLFKFLSTPEFLIFLVLFMAIYAMVRHFLKAREESEKKPFSWATTLLIVVGFGILGIAGIGPGVGTLNNSFGTVHSPLRSADMPVSGYRSSGIPVPPASSIPQASPEDIRDEKDAMSSSIDDLEEQYAPGKGGKDEARLDSFSRSNNAKKMEALGKVFPKSPPVYKSRTSMGRDRGA